MSRTADEQAIIRKYLLSLLRSRRSMERILACLADLAEADHRFARALLRRPETLAALSQSIEPKRWMLEAVLHSKGKKIKKVSPARRGRSVSKPRRRRPQRQL